MNKQNKNQEIVPISLAEATSHILEECRMVLPGIQTLFGFQLICVFNQGFERLSSPDQKLHFISIILIVIAMILVMAPAALHRLSQPCAVSQRLIDIASCFLLWSMSVLAVGICIEVYLVGHLILENRFLAGGISVLLLGLFIYWWRIFPKSQNKIEC
jgi:hypothetical protein